MGLLDYNMSDEARQGLLSFGLGLLANSRGQSTGEAMGRAGMMGLQAYQGAQDRTAMMKRQALQEQMTNLQLDAAKRQAGLADAQQKAWQQAYSPEQTTLPQAPAPTGLDPTAQFGLNQNGLASGGLLGSSPSFTAPNLQGGGMPSSPGFGSNIPLLSDAQKPQATPASFDMRKFAQALGDAGYADAALPMLAKQDVAPVQVADGGALVDPKTGQIIMQRPKTFGPTQAPAASDLGKLVSEMQALPQNSPLRSVYMERIKALTTAPDQSVPVTYQPDASGSYVAFPGKVPLGQNPTPMPTGVMAPPKQAASAKASAQEAADQTRQRDANDALSVIAEAEVLLKESTGSLLGTGIDKAAGSFGYSTEGAKAGARLKALEGLLVSKMPKMSGPQSDKDVLLYKQMAGMIGDTTQPIETRMAALETVKKLQQQYAGGGSSSGRQVKRTGTYMGRKVIEYADGTVEYAQ